MLEKSSPRKAKNSPYTSPRFITPELIMKLLSLCGKVEPFNIGVFIVSYSSFQRCCDVMRKKGDYEVAFRWFSSKQKAREFSISTTKI